MFFGVCAGLGEYASIDPTVVRLVTLLLFFVTGGSVLLAYLIMGLIIPEQPATQPAESDHCNIA
jgi:phage shock protein C